MLAVAACLLFPVSLAVVAAVPHGARAAIFVCGLAAIAAAGLWAGATGRRATTAGTAHPGRAILGTILGFVVGATAAMMTVWALIGLWL